MQNSELTDIEASLQAIVRRAYDLGRNDALKKVVDVLNADRPGTEPLALMAPEPEASETEHAEMNGAEPVMVNGPWWAWPVR